MLGLDRAVITTTAVVSNANEIKIRILQHFNLKGEIFATDERIMIDNSFINWIRIVKKPCYSKFNKERVALELEFNYSRYFNKSNYKLLTQQTEKEIVDATLYAIVSKILNIPVIEIGIEYKYLEIARQMETKRFFAYNNIFSFIYKAFCWRENKSKYYWLDYAKTTKQFYTTGFSVMFEKGLALKVYNKTLEHNKKHIEKVTGGTIRAEFTLSRGFLKTIDSNHLEYANLKKLKKKLKEVVECIFLPLLKKEKEVNEDMIVDNLKKIKLTPRRLETFVCQYQEHIFDADLLNETIKNIFSKEKSLRMIRHYQRSTKEKLKELENIGVKKEFFGNKKKFQEFCKELFGLEIPKDFFTPKSAKKVALFDNKKNKEIQ